MNSFVPHIFTFLLGNINWDVWRHSESTDMDEFEASRNFYINSIPKSLCDGTACLLLQASLFLCREKIPENIEL